MTLTINRMLPWAMLISFLINAFAVGLRIFGHQRFGHPYGPLVFVNGALAVICLIAAIAIFFNRRRP